MLHWQLISQTLQAETHTFPSAAQPVCRGVGDRLSRVGGVRGASMLVNWFIFEGNSC